MHSFYIIGNVCNNFKIKFSSLISNLVLLQLLLEYIYNKNLKPNKFIPKKFH